MGIQILPNPNPEGATVATSDGDYNKETYTNSGAISINAGTFFNYITLNNGVSAADGLLSINNGCILENSGKIINNSGYSDFHSGKIINMLTNNGGSLNNSGTGELTNYGIIVNQNGGALNNTGSATLNNAIGSLQNLGNNTTFINDSIVINQVEIFNGPKKEY